jgi:hypothetical protein
LSAVPALAFAILLAVPGTAWAAPCQQVSDDAYAIEVSATTPKARLDHSKSVEQIKAIAGRNILGMHRTQIRPRLDIRPEYYPVEGGYCYWIASVHLEVASESPYVLIPREYPRDSCNYRAILLHEDKHAVTAKRVIRDFAPNFKRPLTSLAIPKHHSPVFVEDVSARYNQDVEAIWELLEPSFEEFITHLDREQQKVDSEREYRRVFEQCPSW